MPGTPRRGITATPSLTTILLPNQQAGPFRCAGQRNMEHMRYRKLGRTDLEVSEIGYGAWGIGGKQWLGGEDRASFEALHRSFELGLNLIDTALAYGDGHSERLVGHAIRSAPHRVYVATKIPPKNHRSEEHT